VAETPILEFENVDVYYGNVMALERASLFVNPGEIVCLLGGNASGKTTTMKTILGVVRPKRGRVLFKGNEITGMSTSQIIRLGVAMVPENRELFPRLTVQENLNLGAYLRRDKVSIQADLEYVCQLFPRVKDRLKQKAGTLSGGEQQMVAVARALMSRPDFILMDEPSMGLSPALVKQSFEMIERIHAEDKTVFVVEQNANMSLAIADRGYVLQSGRIVLSGTASDLANDERLQHAYLSYSEQGSQKDNAR
jgi:branched-chain amino acid transport system ATP-binding protein